MSDEGREFLEACGAAGPLRFEWGDPTTEEIKTVEIEQAAFVIGSDPAADLVLDNAGVEPYHAFFHVIDGRLFALDLESSGGLRWGEIPRASGWVKRGHILRIARNTIRLVDGDRDGAPVVEPAPTSVRYMSRQNLPRVVLELGVGAEGKEIRSRREVLDRVLVLAGGSDRCKLRIGGQHVARFAFAMALTPDGLWMTNLFPGQGATVNGALCRFARLEDGDTVEIGHVSIRLFYDETGRTTVSRAPYPAATAAVIPAIPSGALGELVAANSKSSPEVLLQPLLELAGSDQGDASSPFGQALVLLVRLLGDIHRDQAALVREELAEIRRISRDMEKLRGEIEKPDARRLPAPQSEIPNGATHAASDRPEPRIEVPPRPSPEAVRELISDRLAAWESERQSRWRKLLRLLTNS